MARHSIYLFYRNFHMAHGSKGLYKPILFDYHQDSYNIGTSLSTSPSPPSLDRHAYCYQADDPDYCQQRKNNEAAHCKTDLDSQELIIHSALLNQTTLVLLMLLNPSLPGSRPQSSDSSCPP